MKIYVSADIEGVAEISSWDEADPTHPEYAKARERMNGHVAAACEGAVAAGAAEILVKDAHAHARNLDAERLPRCARVLHGWSGHPLMMVERLDRSFDAALFLGYHSRAGSGGSPLSHTLSSSKVARMEVNGLSVSEFHIFTFAAALHDVPVVFVSGDRALCDEVAALNPAIRTVPVVEGPGEGTLSPHPAVAEERIRAGVEEALRGEISACRVELPERFSVRVVYHQATRAYRASWYPGARLLDDVTVAFETDDWFEVLRALGFIV